MNKQLILGIIIFIIGIMAHYLLDGSDYTFIAGVTVGVGVGLILTNLWRKIKNNDK